MPYLPAEKKLNPVLTDPIEIIASLMQEGENFSGDCSFQVLLTLQNGKKIILGVTDEDVAQHQGLWLRHVSDL